MHRLFSIVLALPMLLTASPSELVHSENKQWLHPEEKIAEVHVSDLREMYRRRMRREPQFASKNDEWSALHAIAMMDKAHSADFD